MRNVFCLILILGVFSTAAFAQELILPSPKTLEDITSFGAKVNAAPSKTNSEESKPTITGIEIKGSPDISEEKVREAIFSRIGDELYEEKVKVDVKSIYALGYFSDVNYLLRDFKGGKKIIFELNENPVISEIKFEGNTAYSVQELLGKMQTKQFEILNFKTLLDDIQAINNLYKDSGYMLAKVVDVSTDELTGVLTIKIVEGIVEDILIEGTESTKDFVILREMKTRKGSIFNETLLTKDLRRVFNLGFFSEIVPTFQPGSAADKVVILLKIKENRTASVNFGGGYGEREGWFGFIDLTIDNLLGTGRGLMIRGQSGQEAQTYQFRYSEPWVMPGIFGDHATATFRKWYTTGKDVYVTEQNEVRNGFDVGLSKPFTEDIKVSTTLGSEYVSPYADSTFEAYRSDTIGLSFSYDTRDFWMNPTEGSFHTFSTKFGWKQTGITTSFTKYGLDFNQFIRLADKQTLALHLGTGIGFGDVPESELYWAGGANSVRGYEPSDAHTGTKKLITNIEYRYTFNEMFQGVIFHDYGNAWNIGFPTAKDFMAGWGFGVRLNTPLGPIRLDYGIAGGKAIGEGIIHFSIGQAF